MNKRVPSWLSSAVFYQIFPASFMDSNGDGVGDLDGIIQKLDYIHSLGCNAVWINPCFVSPFRDGGYDVADYYTIAPRYGSNADMKRLFKEAARRDIKICLDMVPGHTSVEHPWFIESCKPEKNAFSNRYIWTDSVWDWADDVNGFAAGYSHKPVLGYSQRNGNFFSNYFWFQPALNYGYAKPDPRKKWQLPVEHPAVKANTNEMKNILRFWLDMGASGFRVDMASSLVKGDKGWKQTGAIWKDIRAMFDHEYPQAALIAEWFYPAKAIPSGFHVDFMANGKRNEAKAYTALFRKELKRSLYAGEGHSFFDRRGQGDITEFLDVYLKHYKASRRKGYISLFSGNHDFPRISIDRTPKELEVVFAFLMTMPGVPFIYYGDEIGMRNLSVPSKEGGYHRTGARTPMQWTAGRNGGFSTAASRRLYLPVDTRKDIPNVEAQDKNPASLLNHVRRLTALRKQHPCLGPDGGFQPLYARKKKYPFVYLRTSGREKMMMALNPSQYEVDVKLDESCGRLNWVLKMGSGAVVDSQGGRTNLKMKGISFGIFELL